MLVILDSLKLERSVLVGYSLGGEELSSVGSRYPEHVAGPRKWSRRFRAGVVQRVYSYGRKRIGESQIVSSTWTPSVYGYDGEGHVRFLTGASGAVTDTYDYDGYGNLINSPGTTPNLYLYRGEQLDADLTLYYLRARWYNPVTGRFLSRDPLDGVTGRTENLHKYLYAEGDPVNLADLTGQGSFGTSLQVILRSPTIWQAAVRVVVAGAGVFLPVTFAGLEFYCIMKKVGSVLANAEASMGIVPSPFWTTGACSLPLVVDPRPKHPRGGCPEDEGKPLPIYIVARHISEHPEGELDGHLYFQ